MKSRKKEHKSGAHFSDEALNSYQNYDMDRALRYAKKGAKYGEAVAEWIAASCYRDGDGSDKSLKLSFKYFERSAKQKFVYAYYDLAECYRNGIGVTKNDEKAFEYYLLASNSPEINTPAYLSECISAIYLQLARYYQAGKVTEKNMTEALKYYEKSAEKNCAEAQLFLGQHYEQGQRTNLALAVYYYQQARTNNTTKEIADVYLKGIDTFESNKLYEIGYAFENGKEVKTNHELAAYYIQSAANKGNHKALYFLGWCYHLGKMGLSIDHQKAATYYQQALLKGSPLAKKALASLSCTGIPSLGGQSMFAKNEKYFTHEILLRTPKKL